MRPEVHSLRSSGLPALLPGGRPRQPALDLLHCRDRVRATAFGGPPPGRGGLAGGGAGGVRVLHRPRERPSDGLEGVPDLVGKCHPGRGCPLRGPRTRCLALLRPSLRGRCGCCCCCGGRGRGRGLGSVPPVHPLQLLLDALAQPLQALQLTCGRHLQSPRNNHTGVASITINPICYLSSSLLVPHSTPVMGWSVMSHDQVSKHVPRMTCCTCAIT